MRGPMGRRRIMGWMKRNRVFLISSALSLLVIAYGLLFHEQLTETSDAVMAWVSGRFGWLYVLVVFFLLFFLGWLACGRYGAVRLGDDGDRPEYGNFSWFAMLFCGSTGIGLVFWSVAEPMSHYVSPPGGIGPGSAEAAEFAIRTCFLHWGVTQWACFAIVGLGMAYSQFRKKKGSQVSALLAPLMGEKAAQGGFGRAADVFAVLVSVAGVATSLGLGVSQICGGLNYLWGVPDNGMTRLAIIAAITCVFLSSAVSGINKGIRLLSGINTWLAIGLLALGFAAGPSVRILNVLVNGLGQHLQNLIGDTAMLDPFGDGAWVAAWRVFYFAWFMAWTPFVGMFIARISRGRTVREFILGVVVIPTAVTILWLSVFGTMALEAAGECGLEEAARLAASPETAVFIVFERYPLSRTLSALVIALLGIFFITSADSATFSLGMMTSGGEPDPPKWKRAVWALVEAVMAYVLLSAGSLKPLQTISIAATLPFLAIILAICVGLYKELREEDGNGKGQGNKKKGKGTTICQE